MLPLTGIPRIDRAYFFSFIFLLLGFLFGGVTGDWVALSRAGALIVMISIFIIFQSIDQWSKSDLLYKPYITHPIFIEALSNEDGPDCGEIDERQKEYEDIAMHEMKESKVFAHKVSIHEKALLLSGTFIWGFGDLFPKLLS